MRVVKLYEVVIEAQDTEFGTDQPTWFGIVASYDYEGLRAAALGFKDTAVKSYKLGSHREIGELDSASYLGYKYGEEIAVHGIATVCGGWTW